MNGIALGVGNGATLVRRLAEDVEDASENAFADGNGDTFAEIGDDHAALQTFRTRHGDGADPAFAQVLLNFERQFGFDAADDEVDRQRIIERGKFAVGEFDIDDGSDDLDDFTGNGSGTGRERRGGSFGRCGGGVVGGEHKVLDELLAEFGEGVGLTGPWWRRPRRFREFRW